MKAVHNPYAKIIGATAQFMIPVFQRDYRWTEAEIRTRGERLAERALSIWPRLEVDQALVEAAEQEEMRKKANQCDVSKVQMSQRARELFDALRIHVTQLDSNIIELDEPGCRVGETASRNAGSMVPHVVPWRQLTVLWV